MKKIQLLSSALLRIANRRSAIIFLLLFITIIAIMETSSVGSVRLRSLSGGIGMLDMKFGYSSDFVYALFQTLDNTGRGVYKALLGLDYLFAIIFMMFQSVLLSILLRKSGMAGGWYVLNLLPVLRSVLDIIENGFLLGLLYTFPARFPLVVTLSSTVTMLKWITYAAIIAVGVFLCLRWAWKSLTLKADRVPGKNVAKHLV